MRTLVQMLVVVATCAGTAAAALAQETTGTITGIATDSSGGIVPGATVTVRNLETNETYTLATDAAGLFVVPLLRPGRYEVVVELTGFKKFVRSDLELHVNDRLRVDAKLEPGAVAEAVMVTGQSPVIQTETSDISTLINGTQVSQMPLNGRNIVQLVAMQPGVTSALPSTLGVGLSGLTSVYINGNRASQNNWMIDGADNNDVGSNLALINYVNVDAVSEVKILRSNYSAEFGRSGGGQVNVVTKSGTNTVHGSAFEFLRDDRFDAPNFFTPPDASGNRQPAKLKYNNFGGTVGAPIKKDTLFVFWGEEFRKIRTVKFGGVVNTRVPTSRQRTGDFSEFSTVIRNPFTGEAFGGNVIPKAMLDPLALQLAAKFPLPNADPAVLGGSRNFSAAAPGNRDFREELVRLDEHPSPNHTLYGRWISDKIPSTEPFGEIFGSRNAEFPGISNTSTNNPGRSLVATWNWVVSPTMLAETSYNYARGAIFSDITGNAQRDIPIPKVFKGAPGDNLLPGVSFSSGGYGGFDFFGPYDNTYGSHRVKETITKTVRDHAFKTGLLLSWEFKNENAAGGTNGAFVFPGTSSASFLSTGDAFADFLLGRASIYTETNIDITSHLRFQMYEAFAQDDWKIRPNLTLNLGVRWSYILQPTDTADVLTNFDPSTFNRSRAYQISDNNLRVPGTGDPLNGIIIAGQNSPYGRRVVASHADTIGPRAGFAWDVFGDGKTAVRGGYGRYFDRTLVGIALQNAFVNPPFSFSARFDAAGATVPTLQNPQGGAQRNNETIVPSLIAMSPDFQIPTVDQWSIGIQHELPLLLNLDVAYVGSHGSHLLRPLGLNQTPLGTLSPNNRARPYPGWANITMRDTSATSRYDSLQTSVFRRFQAGVQISLNYTWSKAVSDSTSDRNFSDLPQDVNNLAAERARTEYDRPHVFGAQYVWELPFFRNRSTLLYNVLGGWEIAGSTALASGRPYTVTTPTNSANSFGGGNLRPNLVGDPSGPQTVDQWFNTAAFAQPAPNTFGNSPRAVIRGPGSNLTDLAVFKNFRVTERVGMQYRLEMFNAFNDPNYSLIGISFGTPSFGRITTSGEPRLIQMALKLTF